MTGMQALRQPAMIRAVVGSALLWAWFDALFMGSFFPGGEGASSAEAASVVAFGTSALVSLALFAAPSRGRGLLGETGPLVVLGLCGSTGGALLTAFSYTGRIGLFAVGSLLSGLFVGAGLIAWGAAFCHRGERSATPIAAGSLALAVVFDIPLLLMTPLATSVFFAVFPMASIALFLSLPVEMRSYPRPNSRGIEGDRNPASYIRNYFGISVSLFFAIFFVMVGFGYVQHLSSFSADEAPFGSSGVFVQLIRGGVAVLQFLLIVALSRSAGVVYRAGLLVMIAGFMIMPLMLGLGTPIVSSAVIIGGYTVFDLLRWCLFSQIAYSQSRDALKTIALLRLISSVSYPIGVGLGVLLGGGGSRPDVLLVGESNLIGYLVVVATVLLLSSEDIWALFMMGKGRPLNAEENGKAEPDAVEEAELLKRRLSQAFDDAGFTVREQEVALLLVRGRTQPWIAEFLGISESTVGTHVRHIYQKSGVHTRQEFLDKLAL